MTESEAPRRVVPMTLTATQAFEVRDRPGGRLLTRITLPPDTQRTLALFIDTADDIYICTAKLPAPAVGKGVKA